MTRLLLVLAVALTTSVCTSEIVTWEQPWAIESRGLDSTAKLDPRQGFLPGGSALPPLRLDLAAFGLESGDELTIQSFGDFAYWADDPTWDGVERSSELIGLFMAGGTPVAARLPDGGIAPSLQQAAGRWVANDLPFTFFAGDVTVVIPSAATHLVVGVADTFYPDNVDTDGDFGVRISSN